MLGESSGLTPEELLEYWKEDHYKTDDLEVCDMIADIREMVSEIERQATLNAELMEAIRKSMALLWNGNETDADHPRKYGTRGFQLFREIKAIQEKAGK